MGCLKDILVFDSHSCFVDKVCGGTAVWVQFAYITLGLLVCTLVVPHDIFSSEGVDAAYCTIYIPSNIELQVYVVAAYRTCVA